jgi:hypothetical protein
MQSGAKPLLDVRESGHQQGLPKFQIPACERVKESHFVFGWAQVPVAGPAVKAVGVAKG